MTEQLVILYALGAWLVLLLGAGIVLRMRHGKPTARDVALEEIEARYARAELTRAEYERQRDEILSGRGGT